MNKEQLLSLIGDSGQVHILAFWNELNDSEKATLAEQIQLIDFSSVNNWVNSYVLNKPEQHIPADLEPADYFSIAPETEALEALYENAVRIGEQLIAEGKVALCTVAGGQGTRLGFNGPKGTYPTSIIKHKTLFQLFAEQIIGLQHRYNTELKWYIMTSCINDTATRDFFKSNHYFGLKPENICFFVQGLMPVFDRSGKILLASKSEIAMSPDGHGGTLLALKKSGALQEMIDNGIEHLSYFQVDNPLVSVVSPLFAGLHYLEGADVSARSLTKTGPFEKLGNFCMTAGKLSIIEYSDMPEAMATKTDASGKLTYRAGSPAIHMFRRTFIERITDGEFSLPFHRADKKVAFIDAEGVEITPTENNAVKLETFIFDALPLAQNPVILEAVREEEFAPVKNKTGVDSAESCREMMQEKAAKLLADAGHEVPRRANGSLDCTLEISSASYLTADDLKNVSAPIQGQENYYA